MTDNLQNFQNLTEQMNKGIAQMNEFMRESMEAASKSAAAFTKGLDETSRSAAALGQENLTRLMNASKTIMGAKSPREAMELQAEHLKETFEHMIAGAGRITELSARFFKEAIDPITQHTNGAVSKMMDKSRAA